MADQQPEALRIAAAIQDRRDWYEFDPSAWCPQAAAELRRLHAELSELKAKHQALSYERDGMLEELAAVTAERDGLRDHMSTCRNRPTNSPVGCECMSCGAIFIGGPEHDECGKCAAMQQEAGS